MRYEVVLFDLYGTLIDIHTDEQATKPWQELWEFLDATGAHYDDAAHLKASFDQLNAVNVQEARKGAEHPDWVEPDVLPVFQRLYAAGGSMASPQLAAKAAWVFRKASTSKFGLYPGALEMLGKLREAGIRTVLASNAQACYTRPEIEATGLNKALDRIVISSEEGMRKPWSVTRSGVTSRVPPRPASTGSTCTPQFHGRTILKSANRRCFPSTAPITTR